MRSTCDLLARAGGLLLLALAAACGGGHDAHPAVEAADAAAGEPAVVATSESPPAAAEDPVVLGDADLDAWERGLRRETKLVRAAQERAASASTPAERGEAIRAGWEDATIPEGARAAELDQARYRQVRATVDRVLETLDFQGRIAGPKSIDTTLASPELRERLRQDVFAELPGPTAAAIRARLDRLVPVWAAYVERTATGG